MSYEVPDPEAYAAATRLGLVREKIPGHCKEVVDSKPGVAEYFFDYDPDEGVASGYWCLLPEPCTGPDAARLYRLSEPYKQTVRICIDVEAMAKRNEAENAALLEAFELQQKALSQKLWEWSQTAAELERVKAKEMTLRKELFGQIFPDPREGVNKADLPQGWKVNGTYKLDRKVDEVALPSVLEKLLARGVGQAVDLIKVKPELVVKVYKGLKDEDRYIMDQALIIKPGAPSLELIPPKDGKAHGKVELTRV